MKIDTLKNLANFIGSGCTPSRKNISYWNSKDVLWLKTEQLGEYKITSTSEYISHNAVTECNLRIYPKNTISVAMYGEGKTRGNVSLLGAPMTTNQACCNIEIDDTKIDYRYVYYYLKGQYENLRQMSAGVRKNLNADDIKNFIIRYPEDKVTQKKIAALLGALDDKIALNKKINATLEAMAKTLYDYWFVQFDFPDENGKPYKTSGGKMIYNAELGQDIPDGWKVQNLSEITTIIQGNSPDGSTLNDTGEGTIFFQGKTDFGFRFPEVRIYTTAPYRLAEKFDTLLSVRAPVGDANMAYEKCCIGRGLAAIHSDYPSFIYYTLKKLKPIFEKLGSIGTTFDSITKNDVMALKICIPPTKFVEKFENVVSKFDTEIFNNTNESRQLAALRDWLLPMLMNGQLNFKDV